MFFTDAKWNELRNRPTLTLLQRQRKSTSGFLPTLIRLNTFQLFQGQSKNYWAERQKTRGICVQLIDMLGNPMIAFDTQENMEHIVHVANISRERWL